MELHRHRANVAPKDPGFALHITGVAAPLVIADFNFAVVDATEPGGSSIAVLEEQEEDRSSVKPIGIDCTHAYAMISTEGTIRLARMHLNALGAGIEPD